MSVRTLDLFCGGGGSGWGARDAGAQIVRGVDSWDVAARTYEANFGQGTAINETLGADPSSVLLDGLGKIDLILASPECSNHSCARGRRRRDESSRRTAQYVLRFAERLTPRWMILENVVHMRSWSGFDGLVRDVKSLGYCVSQQVLDASSFGVPQKRRRLFLLCDREAEPPTVKPRCRRVRTVLSDVIMWNRPWLSSPLYRAGRAVATLERADRAIEALGKGTPFLVVYYGSDGSGGWQPVDVPLRTLTTIDRFGLVTWNGRRPMLRMLQPPEMQRAMGFDRRHRLPYGTRRDRIKLLGNAVCPPVMRAVVRASLRTAA